MFNCELGNVKMLIRFIDSPRRDALFDLSLRSASAEQYGQNPAQQDSVHTAKQKKIVGFVPTIFSIESLLR